MRLLGGMILACIAMAAAAQEPSRPATVSTTTIDPDRLQAADRLVAVIEQQGGQALKASSRPFDMADCMDKALDQPGGIDCAKREKDYNAVMAGLADKRPKIVANVKASMRRLYASRFSAAELDAIAAFYRTPAGRHLLIERPSLDLEFQAAENRAFLQAMADFAAETHNDR